MAVLIAQTRHLGLLVVALAVLACDTRSAAERRGPRTKAEDLTDKTLRMDVRVPFRPPAVPPNCWRAGYGFRHVPTPTRS